MVFCLLAMGTAVLAACSTNGGGSIVPQAFQAFEPTVPQSFMNDAHHRRHHPESARVYLRIPVPHHRRHRRMHPQYVSPGTASISFAVQPIAASGPQPTPMPLQTMNVKTPVPCKKTSGSSAALLCNFTVSVMPGRDSFTVKTYSGSNATGKVLSQYSSGPTIVPTPDPKGTLVPLGFTLEGVIDHVVLQYPNTVVPADTKGQVGAIPVGVATTAPLNVTPYDAANFQIMSQVPASGTPVPYSAPVTLSVTPAGNGMTLSNASGSGNSVTISNPNDLNVTVAYSGAFAASGGTVSSTTSFSIAASGSSLALHHRKINLRAPRAATPAPNAAGIALSGNAIPGGTYTTTLTSPSPAGLVNIPGSSAMAFSGSGYNSTLGLYAGILGTATAGVVSQAAEPPSTAFTGMQPDSVGNLWTFDTNTYQIDCFAQGSLGSPAGTIPSGTIFSGQSFSYFAGFAMDSSNNLWFAIYGYITTGGGFETIGYVPINSTSCAAPAPVIYQNSSPTTYPNATSISAIPGTASVAVGAYDPVAGSVIQVASTSPPTAPPAPVVTSVSSAAQPSALFGGSTTYAFMNGALGTVSSRGAFSSVTTYPAGLATFITATTATASSASGMLGATLYNGSFAPYNFVTLLDPADTNASSNIEAVAPAPYCNGIAFDAQDTAWTFCTNPQGNLQFYHIVPTSTWSLIPSTTVPIAVSGCLAPVSSSSYIGILEAFGATAGPFNLTKYNTSVISAVTPQGDRGISFTVTEPAAGSYVEDANVVDKNGRTVPVALDITAIVNTCSPPRPGTRGRAHRDTHARRGYPPISRN
jgi:hypothetical protein